MSRSSSKSKEESGAPRSASQSSSASGEGDDDLDDAGREETPDLYRNSALGMYAGVSLLSTPVDGIILI
jgi:E3 ubiquitin-protein ligase HUWE1